MFFACSWDGHSSIMSNKHKELIVKPTSCPLPNTKAARTAVLWPAPLVWTITPKYLTALINYQECVSTVSSPTSEMDSRDSSRLCWRFFSAQRNNTHLTARTVIASKQSTYTCTQTWLFSVSSGNEQQQKRNKVKTKPKLHVEKAPQYEENVSKKMTYWLKSAEAGRLQAIFTQVYVFLVMFGSTSFHSKYNSDKSFISTWKLTRF